ncbi:hypothetical protein C8J57DRAFT_1542723 [Mycena rebaudengoi]|nr:hypothetical protein C8J57DRAFT_1542723 [Mycena rebaudengoi]
MSHISATSSDSSTFSSTSSSSAEATSVLSVSRNSADYQEISDMWDKWQKKIVAATPPFPDDFFDFKDQPAVAEQKRNEFFKIHEAATKDIIQAF